MNKYICAILAFFTIQNTVLALDVVYPSQEYFKLSSPSTFFIGSANKGERLFLNGKEISIHKTGAFAQSVNLCVGKNEFTIKGNNSVKKYIIERTICKPQPQNQFQSYNTLKTVETIKDNAPIRTTQVQYGINRLSHFQKGMKMQAIGEIKDMYKIKLSPVEQAWVAKSDVKIIPENIDKTFLYDYRKRETNDSYIYEFALSKVTPYSIKEDNENEMTLKIYNISANQNDTAKFKIVLNQRIMGYDLKYDGNVLVLNIKKEPHAVNDLNGIKIVVDAGHGGSEPGAIGCLRNCEKEYNLAIANYLEKYLKEMGANVYMTRYFDKFVSLNDRVKYTNNMNAQIFISIHANSLPDNLNPQLHRGSSVYYYYDEAKPLSEAILNALSREMDINIEGIKQASFAVVRNTSAVSILVETAYVINPDDNELLMNDDFRKSYAKVLANGIKDYIYQTKSEKWNLLRKNQIKFEKVS